MLFQQQIYVEKHYHQITFKVAVVETKIFTYFVSNWLLWAHAIPCLFINRLMACGNLSISSQEINET